MWGSVSQCISSRDWGGCKGNQQRSQLTISYVLSNGLKMAYIFTLPTKMQFLKILKVTHFWNNEWMTKCTMVLSKKGKGLKTRFASYFLLRAKKLQTDALWLGSFLGLGHWGRPPCSVEHSSGSQSTSQCQLAKRRNRRDVGWRANVTVGKWQSEYCQFTIEWFRNVDGDCRKWIRTSRKKTNRAECTS